MHFFHHIDGDKVEKANLNFAGVSMLKVLLEDGLSMLLEMVGAHFRRGGGNVRLL